LKVQVDKKNPLVPEPDREIDQLVLFAETEADYEVLKALVDQFEISGCGFQLSPYRPQHVCLKLERKQQNEPDEELPNTPDSELPSFRSLFGLFADSPIDLASGWDDDEPTTGGGTPEA
jgi:hypothetical protein